MSKFWDVVRGFFNLLGFRADEWFVKEQVKPENIRASLEQAEEKDFATADQAERYAAQMGQTVDGASRNLVTLQGQARSATANADKNMKLAASFKGKDASQEQFYYKEATEWQRRATQYQGQVDTYAQNLAAKTQSLQQAKRIALSFYSTALRSKSDDEFTVADAVMNALDMQFNNQLRGQLGLTHQQRGSDIRGKLQSQIQRQADYNKHDTELLTEMAKMAGMAQYAGVDEGLTDADQQALSQLKSKYGYTPSFEEAPADQSKTASAGSGN